MSDAIRFVFSQPFLVLFVIAICTTIAKVRRGAPGGTAYIAWGEVLFYVVGVYYVYAGAMHAYAGPFVAPMIGWQTSPFEYELGWLEIPTGVVALLALWRGFEMRLAATILFATFALAAAAQHIHDMLCCQNYSPANTGTTLWIADVALPLLVVILGVLAARERA